MNGEQGYLENPLGVAPIGKTLAKFAIPAIISNLISSVQPLQSFLALGARPV